MKEKLSDHFLLDVEAGTIVGRTATGRATASRLQMNRPRQVNARRRWNELGLFPQAFRYPATRRIVKIAKLAELCGVFDKLTAGIVGKAGICDTCRRGLTRMDEAGR